MRIRFSLVQLALFAVLCSLLASMLTAVARSGKYRYPVAVHLSPSGKYLAMRFTDETRILRRRPSGAYRRTAVAQFMSNFRSSWDPTRFRSPFVTDELIWSQESALGHTRISIMEAATGRSLKGFKIPGHPKDVLVAPDVSAVVVQRHDYKLEIWDWGARQPRVTGIRGGDFALSPDMEQIVVNDSGRYSVFRTRDGVWIGSVGRQVPADALLLYSPDGRFIVGGDENHSLVHVWSSQDLSLVDQIAVSDRVRAGRVSDDGQLALLDQYQTEVLVHAIGDESADRVSDVSDWPAGGHSAALAPEGTLVIASSTGVYAGNFLTGRRRTLWSRGSLRAAATHALGLIVWAVVWGLWARREERRAGDVPTSLPEAVPYGLVLFWFLSAAGGCFALFLSSVLFFFSGVLYIPTFYLGIVTGLVAVSRIGSRRRGGLTLSSALQILNILNFDLLNLWLGVTNVVLLRKRLVRNYLCGDAAGQVASSELGGGRTDAATPNAGLAATSGLFDMPLGDQPKRR